MNPDVEAMLQSICERLPPSERAALVLEPRERGVPGTSMLDRTWLSEQIVLRGQRWSTDDPRVLATLWWYSASVWTIGPTLSSLALFDTVLSADPEDLDLHWLPDSRLTGAHSSRLVVTTNSIDTAGQTLRGLYEQVIPLIAEVGRMRERPLWAIAADSLANRLLWLGRAVGEVDRITGLLDPITDAIGPTLPRARYARTDDHDAMHPHRCSCCLLYLAPQQQKCASCPKGGALRETTRQSVGR